LPLRPVLHKLYIKTFGCQMNEYDSARMADVLRLAHGMELTGDPAAADVILFNTCSVREKAQEKVFTDLGRVKHLKRANPRLLIGVGGCVASQEGAAIVTRAPHVDLVFGPQTLHRLPQMIESRRGTGKPQVDVSFPEIEKFDNLPPARAEGATAFVSVMEGCSKYCSFCVVPYTRGEEVSRPFEDVLIEVAELAQQGVKEVTLLGQNVNAYRGATAEGDAADLFSARIRGRDPRHRAHPLHHLASQRVYAAPGRSPRPAAPARAPRAPAGPGGFGPGAGGDEARLYRAGIQGDRAPAARCPPGDLDLLGFHRRFPRRERRRLRGDDEADRGDRLRRELQLHLQPPTWHSGGGTAG
jgi:tRNA-2-methylthio-N6-dimethylallyladenosine synthase